MQTKLRVGSLVFVAGLLWMSPTLAAKEGPQKATASTTKKTAPANHATGVASWYGSQHQGLKMANGQRFDRNKLTAACWYLPLGTVVRVVNLKNGKTIHVTIADRGPNHRLDRLIDLSEAAAKELGFIKTGLTNVLVSRVMPAAPEPADLSAQVITSPFEKRSEEIALNLPPPALQ